VTHLRGLNLTNGRFREELNASTDPSSSCQTTDASAGVDLDLVTPTFIASAGGAAVVRAHLGIRLALDLSSTCHGVPAGATQAAGSFYLNLFLYDLTANRHWAASPAYANTSYVTPNATLVVQRSYNLSLPLSVVLTAGHHYYVELGFATGVSVLAGSRSCVSTAGLRIGGPGLPSEFKGFAIY
jgi:hypothetical protein